VLAEAGDGAEIVTAVLEHTTLERVRRTNPSLANRRL
jgi:predicted amidohydrolase